MSKKRWIIGLSGASGGRYALRLLEVLRDTEVELHIVVSDAALRVLAEEEGIKVSSGKLSAKKLIGTAADNFVFYNLKDIGAAIASGSFVVEGMVVVPCSMFTLAAIANGTGCNLLHRAADVVLKEGRKLIMVPRETPLSAIHLENMLKLARLGVCVLPAMPGFYHQPKTVEDLVDMLVLKITDMMGLGLGLVKRWGDKGK